MSGSVFEMEVPQHIGKPGVGRQVIKRRPLLGSPPCADGGPVLPMRIGVNIDKGPMGRRERVKFLRALIFGKALFRAPVKSQKHGVALIP